MFDFDLHWVENYFSYSGVQMLGVLGLRVLEDAFSHALFYWFVFH